MKAVCYIMVVVVAALAAYPCNDADICIDDQKLSYSIFNAEGHEHSSSEADLCTPFCTCSCCGAHIQVPSIVTYNFDHVKPPSPFVSHSSAFVARFSYSIWQPPKLA